jgi:hypothetical protein
MTRWWLSGGEPSALEPELEPAPAKAEPPPLAPVERIAEILERFYLEDARLAAELLGELRNCSAADLVKLFGPTSKAAPPDQVPAGRGETPHVETEPAAELPAERVVMTGANECVVPNPPAPVWDSAGYRISPKGRSAFAFTRDYEVPPSRSTHWSR